VPMRAQRRWCARRLPFCPEPVGLPGSPRRPPALSSGDFKYAPGQAQSAAISSGAGSGRHGCDTGHRVGGPSACRAAVSQTNAASRLLVT
jgi:hypothetical protein